MTVSRFGERILRDVDLKIEEFKADAQLHAEDNGINLETWEYGDGQSIAYDDLVSMIAGLESARNLIDVNMGKAYHRGIDDSTIRLAARRDLIAEMVAKASDPEQVHGRVTYRSEGVIKVGFPLADWLRLFDAGGTVLTMADSPQIEPGDDQP